MRVGGEYWLKDDMALRLGFLYDQSPVPAKSITPLLPDADRTGFTFGFGKTFGNMTLDVAAMYLMFADADTEGLAALNGIYKNSALLFAVNLGMAIGK